LRTQVLRHAHAPSESLASGPDGRSNVV
jgi:hypothetical protein